LLAPRLAYLACTAECRDDPEVLLLRLVLKREADPLAELQPAKSFRVRRRLGQADPGADIAEQPICCVN
jgi:hypothetical protein